MKMIYVVHMFLKTMKILIKSKRLVLDSVIGHFKKFQTMRPNSTIAKYFVQICQ